MVQGISVMNSILKSALNDEAVKNPQMPMPPLGLVQLLEKRREDLNVKQVEKGKAPFNQITDLSGNIINLDEYSNEQPGSDRRRLTDTKTK